MFKQLELDFNYDDHDAYNNIIGANQTDTDSDTDDDDDNLNNDVDEENLNPAFVEGEETAEEERDDKERETPTKSSENSDIGSLFSL